MSAPEIEVGIWIEGDDIRPRVTHYAKGDEAASVSIVTKGNVVRISGKLTADEAQNAADRFHELSVEIDRRTSGDDR